MYKFNIKNRFKYTVDSNNEYHSFNDQPAIEYFDSTKIWMKHGVIDRCQYLGPAFYSNTKMEYYNNGKLHCDFGPAVIEIKNNENLNTIYFVNGIYKKKISKYNCGANILELFDENYDINYEVEDENYDENYDCCHLIDGDFDTVTIYKKNNQLHRIDGPAFDITTMDHESPYFYKNKQIDMSKITIFNDENITVVYGVNYNNIVNIFRIPNKVLYIDQSGPLPTIHHQADLELMKKDRLSNPGPKYHLYYETQFAKEINENTPIYSKTPNLCELVKDRIEIFEKYILGLSQQQICDQNTWTTSNITHNIDLRYLDNYTGPLYTIYTCGDDIIYNIFTWVNNGVKENIDKNKISIYENEDYIWICGINLKECGCKSILSPYCAIQIKIENKKLYDYFISDGYCYMSQDDQIIFDNIGIHICDLSYEDMINPDKLASILYDKS